MNEIVIDQLAPNSDSDLTVKRSSEASVARWGALLLQMAQDKRCDLSPGITKYWRLKLENYPDDEVCQALLFYSGEFFPSVDQIVAIIERKRERRAEEKAASQAELDQAGEAIKRRRWNQFLFEHQLDPTLTPQKYWCQTHQRELRALEKKMSMVPEHIRRGKAVRRQNKDGHG